MQLVRIEKAVVVGLAVLMVLYGALQLAMPAMMLQQLGVAMAGAGERQLMATIGLLLLILGSALLQALRLGTAQQLLLWVGLEKIGFVALLAIGAHHGVYSAAVWPSVAFDSVAALLLFDYRRRLLQERTADRQT